ncbi:isocitrate lyase/phosphoenolpyruvate mutase family protein [Streptomyces sp. NBC_01275]|uniref:isocitrate lyase/phosphoenolpyruvate mutase family protein n=1 Tax=Streptomyces sp. NBC_01275 TaxID=2903807 RepID=UPI00224D9093|nr:isocitrate lyase/phosphoenolpyruvate mutase family protein [Streptomyces sp. NBC_01275]MCX4763943.1 isocitrate lyase/phosphoenolpyruvate mutase family protein [Streptomyces sp. NBC_01275]
MSAATTGKSQETTVTGARRLRELFARPGVVRIVGAHNPLGARLAERAGFDGVWSSGLEVSASQGVPDTDILTMSELLGVASSLAAAVDVPVVADCDAGYGNAHNVMNMIRRYEAAGISAVSIEDKRFPKVNSFIPGRQELAPTGEFCGKIAAAKAAQIAPDLMVIARIEALIAGWGMEEALHRGEAYAQAGADAVLIHAKGDSPEPVLEFLERWNLPTPVVVVPTTYHTITATELGEAGAKMVIYANHGLRAGITAVTETFETILRDDRTTGLETRIAPLATVFDLQGMSTQKKHEAEFITPFEARSRAVVVPGGGPGNVGLTSALLEHQTSALRQSGMESVTLAMASPLPGRPPQDVTILPERTDAPTALLDLPDAPSSHTVVLSGDAFVASEPLRRLIAAGADIAVLVDVSAGAEAARRADALSLSLSSSAGGARRVAREEAEVVGTGSRDADGEFAGAAAFSPRGFALLREVAEKRRADSVPATLAGLITDLVAAGHRIRAVEIGSGWLELRTADDVRLATDLLFGQGAGR